MDKKGKHLVLFVIVLLLLVPFLWGSHNLYNLGGDDSRLYFYTPSNWLKNVALYSWVGHFFGSYIPQQAYIPSNIFSIVLKFLFPFLNLQKMIYGLILSLGFLTTYLVLKELLNIKNRDDAFSSYYPAILGGLLYVFSPLVFYTHWAWPIGSIYGIAGYPLIFFFFLKAINRKQVKYLIYGSLFSVIFSTALQPSSLTFAFLIGLFIFFIIYLIFLGERLKIIIKYTGIYLLLLFFINSSWTIPWLSSIKQGNPQVILALNTVGKETTAGDISSIASHTNIFDTLCNLLSRGIIYNFNWPQIKIAKYTYGLTPLSIFLPIIIFSAILFIENKKTIRLKKIWFPLAITTLFLAYFETVNITKIGIALFNLFIRYFPGWVMFRNFYGNFAYTYAFFYSLTLGVSLYIISKNISRLSIKTTVFLVVLLVILLQALPFIRGDINNLPLRPDIDDTMNVAIPPHYIDAISTISELEEGKVLSLPLTTASWSFFKSRGNNGMYIGLSPIFVFTGRDDFNGKFAFDEGERFIPDLTSMVEEAMRNRNYEFLGKLFGLLNLRYIFYNSEIYGNGALRKIGEYYVWGYNDFQTRDNIERLINEISDRRIKKIGPISIYELSSEYYYPTIYSTDKVVFGDIHALMSSKAFKVDLAEIPDRPYVLQAPKATVDFRKINPTRYEVRVDAEEPFWLVFSESYHEGWRAYIVDATRKEQITNKGEDRVWYEWSALLTWLFEGRKRIELRREGHYLVNAYANGWYVPQTGQYKITLEFVPQRLFEIGALISITTLAGCLGYLGYNWRRRRKIIKPNEAAES